MNLFEDEKFRNMCIQYHIDPAIVEGKLLLICPKIPSKETMEALAGMIPKDVIWEFKEGLSVMTIGAIRAALHIYGIPEPAFEFEDEGRVTIHFPMLTTEVTQPSSPLWDHIVKLLERDPFTKAWEIRVNEMMYRNSSGFILGQESHKDYLNDPKINDDRFDYDRDFLPKDVGMDVKILLESCGSVEEFLKNI